MDTAPQDIIGEIIESYGAVVRALEAATMPHWLDLELSMAQLKTLFVLAREGSVSIGRIAEALQIGLPTASHLVDRLVQEQLADRAIDPVDRRRMLASLTPQGQQLARDLRQGSIARLREWLQQLDQRERDALATGMRAMARAARSDPRDPRA